MAEGLLRHLAGERFEVFSAGIKPTTVNPLAIKAMDEIGIDITRQRSKSVSEFVDQEFNYVITVCDNARQTCTIFPGKYQKISWDLEDPVLACGLYEDKIAIFRKIREIIKENILNLFGKEEKMKKKSFITIIVLTLLIISIPLMSYSAEKKKMLFHLKTGLKQDDAQICVAYNEIWAALEEGFAVDVLIDASAVNTYKRGFFGRDSLENYKLPEGMRQVLAHQFNIPIQKVPQVYGEYLTMLHNKGAVFYINSEMMITAGVARDENDLEKVSAKFFKPIGMKDIISLRTAADYYIAY